MDPRDVLRACEDMETEGTRLGVIVHSHPTTAPVPSQTDLRELAMPGVVNLIVQLQPCVTARAWEITPSGLFEVPVRADATEIWRGKRSMSEPGGTATDARRQMVTAMSNDALIVDLLQTVNHLSRWLTPIHDQLRLEATSRAVPGLRERTAPGPA